MSRLAVCAVAVLLTLAFVSGDTEGDAVWQPKNSIDDCKHQPDDEVIGNLKVSDEGYYFGEAGVHITYPPEDQKSDHVITCIKVKDLTPEVGATATITDGGVGDTTVSFHLQARKTKSFSYSILIYGKKA